MSEPHLSVQTAPMMPPPMIDPHVDPKISVKNVYSLNPLALDTPLPLGEKKLPWYH